MIIFVLFCFSAGSHWHQLTILFSGQSDRCMNLLTVIAPISSFIYSIFNVYLLGTLAIYLLLLFACSLAFFSVLQLLSICISFIKYLRWATVFGFIDSAAGNVQSWGLNSSILFIKMKKCFVDEPVEDCSTGQSRLGDKDEICTHLCLEAQSLKTKAIWALSGKRLKIWLWAG